MGVDVPQDGHRLHPIGVPDTDEWVFSHLTGGHLDLVWMDGQTETQTGEKGTLLNDNFLFTSFNNNKNISSFNKNKTWLSLTLKHGSAHEMMSHCRVLCCFMF